MKKLSLLLAVAAAVVVTGCSSLQTAKADSFEGVTITDNGTSVAHITGFTSGWYLLSIPLIVGSAETPAALAAGENSCTVTAVTNMITKQANAIGAKRMDDMVSVASSMPAWPIPFLFSIKSVTVSGNAVK